MTNGGLLKPNQQGNVKNYVDVWYHTNDTRNILSLINVKKKNPILYNSDNVDIFIVIIKRTGGHNMIFTANNDGLYYKNMGNTKGVYMLSTMEEKLKHYNQRQHERANIA